VTGAPFPRLLGDVGGTNARFAWQASAGAALTSVVSHRCEDDASLLASIQRYRQVQGLPVPASAAFGMANPITGDAVQMTNHHWSFSIAQLQAQLGVQRLAVINDFTALALSLPTLQERDLQRVGGGQAVPHAAQALLGPGTGLGVSGLLPGAGGHAVPIAGEGGHVTLAPCDAQEASVVAWLRERYGHPSAERALSGPGLVNLYQAAATLAGQPFQDLSAADVVNRARRTGLCEASRSAVDLFCSFLGSVAGNLALTLGARGGVYVGGGIAPRLLPELSRSRFRERFESKGRFRGYLADIPTFVIQASESPALRGASRALDQA
jgi:glucokinase